MKAHRWILAAALATGLSGCAAMSEDECLNSDWRAVGYEDGARGYTVDQFAGRRKACAKHGVTANFDAYQDGRRAGLVEYCQPARGFRVGETGGVYNGVCDAALEPGFLESFRIGRELYRLRSAVSGLSSALSGREAALESIEAQIRDAEASLIAKETTTEDRVLLLADLKDLSERKGSVETEIQNLIADRAAAVTELENYQATVASYGY